MSELRPTDELTGAERKSLIDSMRPRTPPTSRS